MSTATTWSNTDLQPGSPTDPFGFTADATNIGTAFEGVLGAFRQDGYNAGYRRAINNLLADFVLISQEFLRNQAAATIGAKESATAADSHSLRQILRSFEEHLEQMAWRTSETTAYVDGGLGI